MSTDRTPEPGDIYESPDRYEVVRRTTVGELLAESLDDVRHGRFHGPPGTGFYFFRAGDQPVPFGAGWHGFMTVDERPNKGVTLLKRSYPRLPYKLRRP